MRAGRVVEPRSAVRVRPGAGREVVLFDQAQSTPDGLWLDWWEARAIASLLVMPGPPAEPVVEAVELLTRGVRRRVSTGATPVPSPASAPVDQLAVLRARRDGGAA